MSGMENAEANRGTAPARWTIAVGLTLTVLMDALNATAFGIAAPQMAGDLAATPDEATWINVAYLMAKVACLPASASLVDRVGESRALWCSMMVVVATSVLCALPAHLGTFVAVRVVQGAAGAVLLVAAQTILFRLFPRPDQGFVQALYAVGIVIAPISLAPAVQGWLADDASWTWIFWLNLGLALPASMLLARFASQLPNTVRPHRIFDWFGFGLFSLAMAAIVYVLTEGPRWNWLEDNRIASWALVGGGALAVTIGWRAAMRGRSAFFDSSVFTNGSFSFGFFVSFIAGIALFGSAFLLPVFALNVLAMPPAEAGFLLLPSSLSTGAGLFVAAALIGIRGINPLKLVPFGVATLMGAMWSLSSSTPESGSHDLWVGLLARGFGMGILFLAITMVALNRLSSGHVASGVAMFSFGRQVGGIAGISFLDTYLDHQAALNRRVLIESIDPASQLYQERQAVLADALVGRGFDPGLATEGAAVAIQNAVQAQVAALSFNEAFFALVILFVAAAPLILSFKALQRRAGWDR